MRTVRTVAELRAALKTAQRPVGLVPTMGALHDGHLALVKRAREDAETVVVSLFVNPTQFNDAGDLAAYPRDERTDAAMAAEAGADLLFAPDAAEVYPAGFATTICLTGTTTETLEGEHRGREHFDGVATVVTKLFNMVGPDLAYFGEKDAQQLVVIRRLVRDLDIPVEIVGVPTVREPDGLAMSSRNGRLKPADRDRALALSRALTVARESAQNGERDAQQIRAQALQTFTSFGLEPEYLEIVEPDTLEPVARLTEGGDTLVAVAARVGDVRLIDNTLIHVNGSTPKQP